MGRLSRSAGPQLQIPRTRVAVLALGCVLFLGTAIPVATLLVKLTV